MILQIMHIYIYSSLQSVGKSNLPSTHTVKIHNLACAANMLLLPNPLGIAKLEEALYHYYRHRLQMGTYPAVCKKRSPDIS